MGMILSMTFVKDFGSGKPEQFTVQHDLMSRGTIPDIVDSLIRVLRVIGFNDEILKAYFGDEEDDEEEKEELDRILESISKDRKEAVVEVSDEQVSAFVKQLQEKPDFAKDVFRVYMRDMNKE